MSSPLPDAQRSAIHQRKFVGGSWLQAWFSRDRWNERLITCNATWFTVAQGTGVLVTVLNNFPYHARWIRNLGYCFWILTIVLFTCFSVMGLLRLVRYPQLLKSMLKDFAQVSTLGSVVISFDTITFGIILYYKTRASAVWTAYAFFWVGVTLSIALACISLLLFSTYQDSKDLSSVTGVWLLSVIPCIVTAAVGSVLAQYLNQTNEAITLVVSFLLWSVGLTLSMWMLAIYLWRLMHCGLVPRAQIVSCFVAVGPVGMGAYAIQNLAGDLAQYIAANGTLLHRMHLSSLSAGTVAAVAESVHWLGILTGLLLVALGTFWLLEAILAVAIRPPSEFSLGLWACVFPVGVYSNALCALSEDFNSEVFRGWAAASCVLTILLWLACAITTTYKCVWHMELIFAAGVEGEEEREILHYNDPEELHKDSASQEGNGEGR